MSELSNHERRGLEQIQADREVHPDADLLTAFSELVLSPREREGVLAHLAICESCREIVALSAPEPVPIPVPVVRAKPFLWRWPVLRWGAVAASAVVIVAAVSIGYRESKNAPRPMVAQEPSSSNEHNLQGGQQARESLQDMEQPASGSAGLKRPIVRYERVSPESSSEASQRKERDQKADGVLAQIPPAVLAPAHPAASSRPNQVVDDSGSGENTGALSQQGRLSTLNAAEVKGAPVEPVSPAQPSKAEGMPSRAAPSSAESISVTSRDELAAAEPKDLELSGQAGKQKMQMAKKAAVAPPTSVAETMTYSAVPQNDLMAGSRIPQWQVTREGYLQRSYDSGRNWSQALPSSGFRAVAFVQNEVWAGGANGVLLHSGDSGRSWTRISPRNNDILLRGDITGIKFTDTQRGSVTTSAGETWTTSDGGRTWARQ